MPQKSIEQYERELMEMYQRALTRDPEYAALSRRHSVAVQQDNTPKEIDVVIPAPGVEEAVPLPRGIMPVPAEPDLPAAPAAVAAVLPVPGRAASNTARPADETAAELDSGVGPDEDVVIEDEADLTVEGEDVPAPEPTPTPTQEPMRTPTPTLTRTPAPTPTQEPMRTPTPTLTRAPAPTPTQEPMRTPAPTLTRAPTSDPTPESPPTPAPMPRQQSQPRQGSTPAQPASEEARRMTGSPNIGAGSLIVNVTTQNRTLPVAQALVTVRESDESGDRVVATVRTDSSGKTELIRLPAPIREIPVYPQPMIGGDLSAGYLVDIEAPGFEAVQGETVSIFDGVTSVKRIDLVAEPDAVPVDAAAEDRDDAQRT